MDNRRSEASVRGLAREREFVVVVVVAAKLGAAFSRPVDALSAQSRLYSRLALLRLDPLQKERARSLAF